MHFLFETRAGHCEYFASSLTVMRTLGFPRAKSGFLPGEYSELGGDYIVRASDAHSWVEAYFPGSGWIVFDPTPDAPAVKASFFTRLSQFADWAELTWNDWIISYDFAHQNALAQSFQMKSRNWRELGTQWFFARQRHLKDCLSMWQIRHSNFSYALPLVLVALLVALRYGWIGRLLSQLKIILPVRGRNASAASSQIASRMYSELTQLMGRLPAAKLKRRWNSPRQSETAIGLISQAALRRCAIGGATCDVACNGCWEPFAPSCAADNHQVRRSR